MCVFYFPVLNRRLLRYWLNLVVVALKGPSCIVAVFDPSDEASRRRLPSHVGTHSLVELSQISI